MKKAAAHTRTRTHPQNVNWKCDWNKGNNVNKAAKSDWNGSTLHCTHPQKSDDLCNNNLKFRNEKAVGSFSSFTLEVMHYSYGVEKKAPNIFAQISDGRKKKKKRRKTGDDAAREKKTIDKSTKLLAIARLLHKYWTKRVFFCMCIR